MADDGLELATGAVDQEFDEDGECFEVCFEVWFSIFFNLPSSFRNGRQDQGEGHQAKGPRL